MESAKEVMADTSFGHFIGLVGGVTEIATSTTPPSDNSNTGSARQWKYDKMLSQLRLFYR